MRLLTRLLASLVLAAFAIALAAMPTAVLASAPDVNTGSLQAITANVVFEISSTPILVDIAENPAILTASSATTPTNTAIAWRSMPVIKPIAAAVDNNVEYANYPNPSNATAKITIPATATTGTASADDNFGAVARSGTSLQAAQGENSLTALYTATGVASGATMRFAA